MKRMQVTHGSGLAMVGLALMGRLAGTAYPPSRGRMIRSNA
jgi:hypothetical protein